MKGGSYYEVNLVLCSVSVNWLNSCVVLCDMCHLLLLCVFAYFICCGVLCYRCHRVDNPFAVQ
jgi:hypothetical protein